jgi:hypothetical protein
MHEFYNRKMAVWALGLNHNTAPLDLRGKFAFAIEHMPPVLSGLKSMMKSQGESRHLVDLQQDRDLLRCQSIGSA